ncbi:hypothetical protein AB5N10_01765 [Weissella paramesenteroides]|uniref:hypothetical protein n=1 Tax=Weissella paramesenteroides TaxID=1249 RepID=UPI0015E45AFF|nr:hypothetical protein [Weissella paramesenteroides]MBU7556916.1 hypothetical protein [Weissella paramesenteroides]QPI45916.1 hypothetical protein I2E55_07835 [Weissella paramesenteroides]
MKNNNNNEEQPLFKSMSKNVETRSMPKSKLGQNPEDYINLYDQLKKEMKQNKNN